MKTQAVQSLFAFFLVGTLGHAASLTTTYAGGNEGPGAMFDVVALHPITITGLAINLFSGRLHTFEIYGRSGTWVGHQDSSAGWTLLGSTSVNSAGNDVPTTIPISLHVSLAAGDRYAFYATSTNWYVVYTNGSAVGNVFASDTNLQILEGAGKGYPFGDTFTPRVVNATITYSLPSSSTAVPVPALDTAMLIVLALLLVGLGVMLTRRRSLGAG